MAKVKVRVLVPGAIAALGYTDGEELEIDAAEAVALVAAGYAEKIGRTKTDEAAAEAEPTEAPRRGRPPKAATDGK